MIPGETPSLSSGLHREIIGDILRLGRDEAWAVGAQVGEKPLAGRLGVSRTPVRRALIDLSERGILRREPGTGFKLSRPIDAALIEECGQEAAGGDLYQQLLRERSAGQISEEVTENALIAHFNASRGVVRRALQRLAAEGVVQRQRGHGWRFNESLQTPQAIIESYAFREAVECAALSQPDYRIDRAELERMRAAHQALMRKPAAEIAPEVWFRVNAHFHETVTSWSRNRFFLQAVKRQNTLRRMHQFADFPQLTPEQIAQSCEEHLAILDALAIGDRKQAAALLSAHLRQAAQDWQS